MDHLGSLVTTPPTSLSFLFFQPVFFFHPHTKEKKIKRKEKKVLEGIWICFSEDSPKRRVSLPRVRMM
jgi:hypothetical protein